VNIAIPPEKFMLELSEEIDIIREPASG